MRKTSSENSAPVPKGILVIIGGHENKDDVAKEEESRPPEILEVFVKLIEKEDPVIEVITTASSEGDESFEDYRKAFENVKVKRVNHIHHDNRVQVIKDELAERIENADAVFLTGGDQLKLTSIYGGTNFLTHLKERYINEKIVVGGTSAGAMALSTPMIYAGTGDKQQVTGEIKITTGLEFLKDVCVDTHFIDRSRFIRMAQVIATNPTSIGIGIEENTAIVVRNGVDAEVIGQSLVTVIEGYSITNSSIADFNDSNKICIQDMTVHLLPEGSSYVIPQTNPPHK